MARRKKDPFLDATTWVVNSLIEFVGEVYKAGRIVELLISGSLLAGLYCVLYLLHSHIIWWVYLIPAGVFAGWWHYLLQHEKVTSTKANPNWVNRDWWWKLDGWEFEEEAAKVFRLNGYKAKVTKKTSDGGIDIIMYKNGKKIIAQSKHYKSPVGVSVARELNGLKDDFKADELLLIASSGATKATLDFIKNKPYFKILDLEDVIRMGLRSSP
jgi:hypothetical protein